MIMRNGSMAAARVLVAAALAGASAAAHAQFAGPYAPSQATITTSHGGSIDTSGAPSSITLYGGSDSGGFSDQTYAFTLLQGGSLSFDWNYTQNDCCGAEWDPFGYLLNGTFYQLTTAGDIESGTVNLSVNAGDAFAFDQRSVDSASGFATTVVSKFSAPGSAVPEPATWSMMLLGFGAIGGVLRFRRRNPKAGCVTA